MSIWLNAGEIAPMWCGHCGHIYKVEEGIEKSVCPKCGETTAHCDVEWVLVNHE